MFIALCRLIFKLRGWKLVELKEVKQSELERCMLIAAPHTSNWDAIYTIACFDMLGVDWRFTIKKEWMKPPFGGILRSVGALPIDRTPKKIGNNRPSMVEVMHNLFKENEKLCITITPEGTRKKRTEWKLGFYHTAKLAGVPICLGYLDYSKKEAGITKTIHLTDDMEADIREIMAFYKDIKGKHPDKFSLDERYS